MRRRLYFSTWAFAIALGTQFIYRIIAPRFGFAPVYDLWTPICGAHNLLLGLDPYNLRCVPDAGRLYPSNPMTTILVSLPFAPLGYLGAMVLWSLGVGLLTYGILRGGEPWRLLLLTSAPFVQAFLFLQWSPLILAVFYLPELLPLALAKVQIGLPIILTHLTRRRVVVCAAFVILTFIVDPWWLFKWLPQARSYDGFIPLLVLPFGLCLPFALFRWQNRSARFLALLSITPQRGFYDALLLWTIPQSPRQMLALSVSSWIGYLAWSLTGQWNLHPLFVVASCYLPVLALQLVPVLLTSISHMPALDRLRLAARRRYS